MPQQLKNSIIEITHGEIIEKVDLFKGKEREFLFEMLPSLKPLKILAGDFLFQEDDFAEEIYLIKDGKVSLHKDCSSFISPDQRLTL